LSWTVSKKYPVYDQVDFENGKRPQLVSVKATVPVIPFSNWRDQEEFNIMLQSMFIDDADRNLVLDFASHLKIEKGAEVTGQWHQPNGYGSRWCSKPSTS